MIDNVIYNDPPRHAEIRSLVAAAFTKRMVARFGDWITEVVDNIVDGLHGRGSCDLVPLVAVELPAQVICSVIGVPAHDRDRVVHWTNEIFSAERADGQERAMNAIQETMQYALEMRYTYAQEAESGLVRELALVERDGAEISDSIYMQLVMSLLTAGFETTHTLIGQSLRLILENPDVEAQAYAAARAGDTAALVDEFLRHITPAMHMARHATRDVVLHDTEIKAGDMVLLWHVSANRDEQVFERPHVFDASRPRHPHQAFGAGGPHFCIGNQLARLEVQILLRELLTRGPKITLDGKPERGWSVFINQLRSLPVVCP
jgi:cytochrome P450